MWLKISQFGAYILGGFFASNFAFVDENYRTKKIFIVFFEERRTRIV